VTSHSHSPSRCEAISPGLRPGHGGSGASCSIRAAAPAAAHAAGGAVDGSPRRPSDVPGRAASASTGGFRHKTLRSRDRRHGHRLDLDVGARLISVDLQEHVADAQGRALVMGDDDLDLLHVGHYRGMTTGVTTGLSGATARLTASRCPAALCKAPAAVGPGTASVRQGIPS
jgi:hypothetical protein